MAKIKPFNKALKLTNLSLSFKLKEKVHLPLLLAVLSIILKFSPMIWYDENFDATDLWRDVKVIPEVMDYLWGKVFREIDITKNLEKLNIPVFLGLGRYDYWNPPHLWEAIRPHFRDLTIRVFEKSGHTPQYEEPELFDQELLSWLNANLKREASR
jgi:proline iminopeptidase